MTDRLPPNLVQLFTPRPPIRYLPPNDHAPEQRQTTRIDGVAGFMAALREKKEAEKDTKYTDSDIEIRARAKQEKAEAQKHLVEEGYKELYKPHEDPKIRGDPFKTIFVGRLPYDCTTDDLRNEFERFGSIERMRLVKNENKDHKSFGKLRGYAFILFHHEHAMKAAYAANDKCIIRGRKVVVDAERGRTVNQWRPRRFGGGLGGRHYTKIPARTGFGPPSGPGGFPRASVFERGGFRGGRGGGFRGGRGGGFRGGPPNGAPSGPRTGGGFGGGGRFDDRGSRNANFEPLPTRGGYRDQDRDRDRIRDDRERSRVRDDPDRPRDRDYNSGQKRPYGSGGYDDPRQRRRY